MRQILSNQKNIVYISNIETDTYYLLNYLSNKYWLGPDVLKMVYNLNAISTSDNNFKKIANKIKNKYPIINPTFDAPIYRDHCIL